MLIHNMHSARQYAGAERAGRQQPRRQLEHFLGQQRAAGPVGGTTLGGTDFLTLMLAQLKNQDPTNPVDSNTFLYATCLAQRSAGHHQSEYLFLGAVEFHLARAKRCKRPRCWAIKRW